jgi:hypothetical protein
MRCRDFVAGLLLAGAGRRRATRRREQQHVGCNQAMTEISLPHWTDGARAPPHGAASSGRPMSRSGTKRTYRVRKVMSAFGGNAENMCSH